MKHLIKSFDTDADPAVEAAWAEESEKRLNSYKNGLSATFSEEEVFKKVETLKK